MYCQGIWYDYFTNEKFIGGKDIEVDVAMDTIPVFVKAGSIVPTVQVMNYIDEIPDAPYTVKVFTGEDGEFMLYDDSGCDYGYEKGEYSRIRIAYDDTAGEISYQQTGEERFSHRLEFELIG